MNRISAVIIACNEERNIARCIESLHGVADEVIVVDSGSTDATADICHSLGVQFIHQPWLGYSAQKNLANDIATGDLILSIDADEALSAPLRESLINIKQGAVNHNMVYAVNRLNNYCGHWVRHCGWYPDRKVRIWTRGIAHWEGEVHEELIYNNTCQCTLLDGDLLHYTYYNVSDHAQRQVRYATLAGHKAYEQGKRCSVVGLWLRPGWTFVRSYLLKGGFRDGQTGFTICRMAAFYTFVKYAVLRQLHSEQS